jgi:hypothetical protein
MERIGIEPMTFGLQRMIRGWTGVDWGTRNQALMRLHDAYSLPASDYVRLRI